MSDLLTVKQLQDLLQVDRVTIYRMLSDGRLPGFKVGGQWRFSQEAIDEWLSSQQPEPEPHRPVAQPPTAEQTIPLACIQPVQDIFAYATEVGALITDLTGAPLTQLSNCADFCRLILSTPQGQAQCQTSWQTLAVDPDDHRQAHRCHAGLCYLCRPVKVDQEPVAVAFCGQYLPAGGHPTGDLAEVADRCGLDQSALVELKAAAAALTRLQANQITKLNELLDKAGDAFSHIAQERHNFTERLSRIADMTKV